MKVFAAASILLCATFVSAQTTLPANIGDPNTGYPFKSAAASILKPPAGARVALIEFEDME